MLTPTSSTPVRGATPPRRAVRAALWVAQALLAAAFAYVGITKLTQPVAALAARLSWVANAPPALVRFVGAAELAGALGLVLPALTRIRPRLTVLAAVGLALVMVLAVAFHLARGEGAALPVPAALGLLATFVAWGRRAAAPVLPRDR